MRTATVRAVSPITVTRYLTQPLHRMGGSCTVLATPKDPESGKFDRMAPESLYSPAAREAFSRHRLTDVTLCGSSGEAPGVIPATSSSRRFRLLTVPLFPLKLVSR